MKPLPPTLTAPPELDELTLARAKRGDEVACRALVVRYQHAVFALLSRLLRAHDGGWGSRYKMAGCPRKES